MVLKQKAGEIKKILSVPQRFVSNCTRFFNSLDSCPKQMVSSQCSLSVKSQRNCCHSDVFFLMQPFNGPLERGNDFYKSWHFHCLC